MMTQYDSISFVECGGIAQLARAHGSYPWCRWFKSDFRYHNPKNLFFGFFVFKHRNVFGDPQPACF